MNRVTDHILQHPALIGALGICPLAANAATLTRAVTISMAFTIALVLSSLSVSIFRNLIPHSLRMVFIFLITATWVTCIDLLLQTYFYEMRLVLGIYLPLIAVNSLFLYVLEREALVQKTILIVKTTVMTSAGIASILVAAGIMRELFGRGMILSDIDLIATGSETVPLVLMSAGNSLSVFSTSAGAFIAVACVIAAINFSCYRGSRSNLE